MLAGLYERHGDQREADALRASPTLTPAPSIVALSVPLSDADLGRVVGQMLTGRVTREVADAMARYLNADDLGDLVGSLAGDARLA